MQFHTLPEFFSKDNSPMSATDSPFPPLKTEHRYRGVYERAGFDVNLNGPSPDSASARFSPFSPRFQGSHGSHGSHGHGKPMEKPSSASIYSSQPRNVSAGSMPRSAYGSKPNTPSNEHYDSRRNFSDSRINQRPEQQRTSGGSGAGFNPYAHLKSQNSVSSIHSGRSSHSGHSGHSGHSSHSRSITPNPAPYVKKFEAENVNPRLAREHDSERNKKNLKLHIPEGKSQYIISQETAGTSATNSPFDTDRNERSSPSTSLSSHGEAQKRAILGSGPHSLNNTGSRPSPAQKAAPYPISGPEKDINKASPYPVSGVERDLNEVLAGFKQDVAEHRHYDPRGSGEKPFGHQNKSPVNSFVPSTSNLAPTFGKQTDRAEEVSSQDEESFHFDSPRHSTGTTETSAENSNDDYNQYLRMSNGPKPHRNPHLSTISSIISKPYDDESDEDDEIELELKRQLENIKSGSSISLESGNLMTSEDSFVTASNVSAASSEKVQMPIFKVSGTEEIESEGSDTETEFEGGTATSSPEFSEEDETQMQHKYSHSQHHQKEQQHQEDPLEEPETPQFEKAKFDDALTYETPETIKPLSPKNHQVERELENLNLYNEPRTIAQELSYTPRNEEHEDDILRQNPTPQEFEAFPRSVIDPKVPNFRTSEVHRNPAGTGPCRTCGLPVEATSGPKKAIFSKTGELSGQWHRACFSCSYAGCEIHFNKNVTSYVLLDNPFCNHHYHSLNDTLCQTCHYGIEGECIENELKQKWHLHCLACTKCKRNISTDYFLIDGKIICEADSEAVIADLERSGLLTSDKVEKRRTRMLFLD